MASSENASPRSNPESVTDSSDSPLVVFDGPGDTTIRRAPANLPRYFPGREPPPGYPGVKPPPENPPRA